MVSKRYANPNYVLTPLRRVIHTAQYGISLPATEEPIGIPMIRMNNLQNDGWDLTDLKYIELSEKEAELYRVNSGDILFTRTNSKELVGKCEVFGEEGDWVFASYLIRIVLDQTKAIPKFVSTFLSTKAGRIQIDRVSRQIIGMSNVNAEELQDLLIPLPPIEIQRSLVAEIEAARQSRKQKLAQADELLSSLDGYLLDQLGLNMPQKSDKKVFAMSLRKVRSAQRIDVDYFHPERIIAIREQEDRTELHSKCLAEFVDFVRHTISDYTSASYIGMANVQRNTGELVESNDKETEGKSFAFIEDDILFARLRPYLNKVYRAERTGVCSTEFHVIRIKEEYRNEILPDYLATILRSSLILAQTKHMMTGNTHPRLANEDVINLVVPTPELEIQERLVIEVKHRRTEVRRLRQEAETEWESAKTHFERKLLGEEE